jgi:AraC family L-rhamnose operon regulatory protein RhaS
MLLLGALRADSLPRPELAQDGKGIVNSFWQRLRANPEELAQSWTLRKMAQRCGLGQTRFVFYTRHLTNLTPLAYLNHCRLEQAARLLREQPDRNVTVIALECGFESGQYFARKFAQLFRCAPHVYRAGGGDPGT